MWLILLTGYYVLGTVTRLERRRLAVRYPQYNISMMVLFFLMLLPIGVVLSLFLDTNYSAISPGLMLYTFIGSAVWPLSGYVGYRANVLTGAGLFAVLGSIAPLVTVAIALVFLGETLTLLGFVGVAFIVFANVLVKTNTTMAHNPIF